MSLGKKLSACVMIDYLERMKTAVTKKKRRRTQIPFACKGWRDFVMRSKRADQAARGRRTSSRHRDRRDIALIQPARRDRFYPPFGEGKPLVRSINTICH
jgi:hypothetical protein